MEKSKVLIQFLVIFRQFVDVLSFFYACRLRGYTATLTGNENSRFRKVFDSLSGILYRKDSSTKFGSVCPFASSLCRFISLVLAEHFMR